VLDEMLKPNSLYFLITPLVLSCLDQLNFIECHKQIIIPKGVAQKKRRKKTKFFLFF
jgi:hypothetical protein